VPVVGEAVLHRHSGIGPERLHRLLRRPDLVKVNFPQPGKQAGVPQPYRREFSSQEAIEALVRSANRSLLLVSGIEQAGDEAMLEKPRQSMEAGATGLIFGRNVFQRGHAESLQLVAQLKEILAKYPG
jgi:fructose-bisphosphate aldolase, class I